MAGTTLTQAQILRVVRQKIGQAIQEVGGEIPALSDPFLLEYVQSADFELNVMGIVTGIDVDIVNQTIIPDPSLAIGMILAASASSNIIADDLVNRIKAGELGLAFTSGATSITTNQAAITLKLSADKLDKQKSLFIAAYLSGDPNNIMTQIVLRNYIFPLDPVIPGMII